MANSLLRVLLTTYESHFASNKNEIARLRKRVSDQEHKKIALFTTELPFVAVLCLLSYAEGYSGMLEEIAKTHGDLSIRDAACRALERRGRAVERVVQVDKASGARQRHTGSWISVMWEKEPLDDEPKHVSDKRQRGARDSEGLPQSDK
jgi:hypothetical protein